MNDGSNSDPLDALEELLDAEDFEPERISVVIQHPEQPPPSKYPSFIVELAKRNKKAGIAFTLLLGIVAWLKIVADIVQAFR